MRRVLTTTESPVRPKLLLGAALLAACALSLAPARAGQSGPPPPVSSMLDGAVTYTLPASWHISMWMNRSTHGAAQIHDTGDAKTRSMGSFLSAYFVPEGKTVVDMGSANFGSFLRKTNGGTVLSDKSDGEGWRTVIWTQVQATRPGQPELLIEHFGIVNRKFVDLTMSVTLGTGDVEGMKKAVADFNAVCKSLKIDGRGECKSVSPDIITKQLKVSTKK